MTPRANTTELLPSDDRFEFRAVLGRGAMGVVYRAHDRLLGVEVAVKTIQVAEPESLLGLKSEFRALADIRHPNLVELYSLTTTDEQCLVAMELLLGPAVASWVRPRGTTVEPSRIVDVALQLTRGLMALHDAGTLHRDVKPTNVGMAGVGRAVLLDFGLAAALHPVSKRIAGHDGLVGSPAYMAPEQSMGGAIAPSADWYGFGSLLFELVSGRTPFAHAGPMVLAEKSIRSAPPLASVAPNVLPELAELVDALLARDPGQRPSGAEVEARLLRIVETPPRPHDRSAFPSGTTEVFVGREAERGMLERAWRRARSGRLAVVHVRGPSGIGKSALLRRFLLDAEADGALTLRGRCHPHEAVPFNAFDALVDDLSGALWADRGLIADRPPAVGALLRLFPVLRRIPDLQEVDSGDETLEPHERRRLAFGALRELMRRLAAARPLVVWIDDLQWSDVESLDLLREITRPPNPPAVLLVLSYRAETAVADLERAVPAPLEDVDHLALALLDHDDLSALVRLLCQGLPLTDARIDRVMHEAAGSPFFATQLVQDLAGSEQRDEEGGLDLTSAIARRLGRLSEAARAILEVVCVSGRPLRVEVAIAAADADAAEALTILRLEREHVLRSATMREGRSVEVYHDRIRESVLDGLAVPIRRAHHSRLATALEARTEFDAEEVFSHFLEAGDADGARRHGEGAGDRAADATAFERAARLYRQTLDLGIPPNDHVRLLTKTGAALSHAGRSIEAAESYETALRAAPGTGADVVDLHRRTAEQYLRGGGVERGVGAIGELLADLGLSLPSSPGRALGQLVVQRARLALRRRRPPTGPHGAMDVAPRARLDALWRTGITLALFDPVLADLLTVRHFREALDLGDPAHLVRAFATEAAKSAQIGGGWLRRRSHALLDDADRIAVTGSEPYDRAFLSAARGNVLYEEARWRESLECQTRCLELLRAHCRDVSWEMVTAETFALSSLAYMGRLRELRDRLPAAIASADDRRDGYAAIGLRGGFLGVAWLAADTPDDGMRDLDRAMASAPNDGRFRIQDYVYTIAAVQAALYVGDVVGAWRRIDEAWPRAKAARFLSLDTPALELRFLRGRAALAAAALPATSSLPTRDRLIRIARTDARRVANAGARSAPAYADVLLAGVSRLTGDERAAIARYESAARTFDAVDMRLHAAAARVAGGDETDPGPLPARAWMHAQAVRNPERLAAMLVVTQIP